MPIVLWPGLIVGYWSSEPEALATGFLRSNRRLRFRLLGAFCGQTVANFRLLGAGSVSDGLTLPDFLAVPKH
jgi:hypothetical protein